MFMVLVRYAKESENRRPPGALHHIIARGIERGKIFKDDLDRNDFLERFGAIVLETDSFKSIEGKAG